MPGRLGALHHLGRVMTILRVVTDIKVRDEDKSSLSDIIDTALPSILNNIRSVAAPQNWDLEVDTRIELVMEET